ncbi:hypothetical protein V8D89_012189 [Ganoderma adspersum]
MPDSDHLHSDPLPLPKAQLISLFVESLLFGAFLVLYSISIWILLTRDQRSGYQRSTVNKGMLGTATVMFVLAVAHICFDVQRALDGFITHGGTPTGTLDFYFQLSNPTEVGKSVIYVTQTLVGDAFVAYRLYVVYNRNAWMLALPLVLLFGTSIAGYGVCYELAHAQGAVFASNLKPWITSFFSLSLTTNVIATILLAARIMWSNHKVKKYRTSYVALTHWTVIETIVQSAAIYSAALISLLATYVAQSNAQYICIDALNPVIGITFTLIIIRVGLSETASTHSKGHMADSLGGAPSTLGGGQPYPLRPLAVSVSVARTHDRPSFDDYDQKAVTAVESDVDVDVDIESRASPGS